MIIRPAHIVDCVNIASIQVENYQRAYAGLLPADYLRRFSVAEQTRDWKDWFKQREVRREKREGLTQDRISTNQGEILLVSENEATEICGYALGRLGISNFPPYQSELVALHVRAPCQGQGIGRGLVVEMAYRLKADGCSSMMCWVLEGNPARQFYERLGGQEIGKQTITLDEYGTQAVEIAYGWKDISKLTNEHIINSVDEG